MFALLDDPFGHRAALDASFLIASRLRARPGDVSGTASRQFTGTTASVTRNATGGNPAKPDSSPMDEGNDSVSQRPSRLDSRTGSASDVTASPRRGSFSRRSVASSRLAEQVFSSTYTTENDSYATPKPTLSDPHIAARDAYASRRKQLEEEHFGKADPYGVELQSTPLARNRVEVQQEQRFRARLPTESVSRHISHVRSAQIVQGANKTPTLL